MMHRMCVQGAVKSDAARRAASDLFMDIAGYLIE